MYYICNVEATPRQRRKAENALVVQRIEQKFPKLLIAVRFCSGVHNIYKALQIITCSALLFILHQQCINRLTLCSLALPVRWLMVSVNNRLKLLYLFLSIFLYFPIIRCYFGSVFSQDQIFKVYCVGDVVMISPMLFNNI